MISSFFLPAQLPPSQSLGALSGATGTEGAATFQAGAGGGWTKSPPDLEAELISRRPLSCQAVVGHFLLSPGPPAALPKRSEQLQGIWDEP